MSAFMPDRYVQIDLKDIKDGFARCNLYTGQRCIPIIMPESEYRLLQQDGFFLRPIDKADSAGILNTTDCYYLNQVK